jgi:hypothetical protein
MGIARVHERSRTNEIKLRVILVSLARMRTDSPLGRLSVSESHKRVTKE